MMDFKNAKELLHLCEEAGSSISDIMLKREIELGEISEIEALARMEKAFHIMRDSARTPVKTPVKSMGGLIGGEARKLSEHQAAGKGLCGPILEKAITYAMAVLETNSSMGLIVAAPTAGSAGIVPGLMLAFQEIYGSSDEQMIKVLFNAGAVGYLAMRNATVAGAVGGCQAEVGSAAAMAAAALVQMLKGTPKQALDAASIALSNLLGLVCDPVGGLVEVPCQNRNAIGVACAFSSAQLALSSIESLVPFDEMAKVMLAVGHAMPSSLRETAKGGIAIAPSALSACARCGACA